MKIQVKVRPGAKEQSVEKVEDLYFVRLKSRPEEGKANLELLKLLKKHFNKDVKIKSGFTSRNKIVEVLDY